MILFEKVIVNFNYKDKTLQDEIIRNILTILSTPAGSIPLDRDFGIELDILDAPLPVAKNQYQLEVYEKIQQYEPRVIVFAITFSGEFENGNLIPIIELIEGDINA